MSEENTEYKVITDRQRLESLLKEFGITDIREEDCRISFNDIGFQFSSNGNFRFMVF